MTKKLLDGLTDHCVYTKPDNSLELKPNHQYYWWLTSLVKPEYSSKDDWVIVYADLKNTKLTGTFCGPIENDFFNTLVEYEVE